MPRAFYLVPTLGSGVPDDKWRPQIPPGINWVKGASNPNWSLIFVDGPDLSALDAQPQTLKLLDEFLDSDVSTLSPAERNRLKTAISARFPNFDPADYPTKRAMLRAIGKFLGNQFAADSVSLRERGP